MAAGYQREPSRGATKQTSHVVHASVISVVVVVAVAVSRLQRRRVSARAVADGK